MPTAPGHRRRPGPRRHGGGSRRPRRPRLDARPAAARRGRAPHSSASSAASGVGAASSSLAQPRRVGRAPQVHRAARRGPAGDAPAPGKNGSVPPGRNATPTTCSCSAVSMIWKRVATPLRIEPEVAWHYGAGPASGGVGASLVFLQVDDELGAAGRQHALEGERAAAGPRSTRGARWPGRAARPDGASRRSCDPRSIGQPAAGINASADRGTSAPARRDGPAPRGRADAPG